MCGEMLCINKNALHVITADDRSMRIALDGNAKRLICADASYIIVAQHEHADLHARQARTTGMHDRHAYIFKDR